MLHAIKNTEYKASASMNIGYINIILRQNKALCTLQFYQSFTLMTLDDRPSRLRKKGKGNIKVTISIKIFNHRLSTY
jgi:hypothetical protein